MQEYSALRASKMGTTREKRSNKGRLTQEAPLVNRSVSGPASALLQSHRELGPAMRVRSHTGSSEGLDRGITLTTFIY